MILDSTFLVDLERETRRKMAGPATRFLEAHPDTSLAITFTIAGELAAGGSLGADRTKWDAYIRPFRFLGFEKEVAWRYGEIYRDLSARGMPIGSNDLWIAATALAYAEPIVTRNRDEFSRVRGLDVLGY